MNKLITINYLSHDRLAFHELTFHFLSKIKEENKDKIVLNILASKENNWSEICSKLGIECNIYIINSGSNYLDKIRIAVNSNTEYSVKLDEDCFISNHVWDFMIENIDAVISEDVLLVSPIMSNNIPSCDYFINDYIDDDILKGKLYSLFLNRNMPNGLWGVDYTPLNEFTIHANEWDYKQFYNGVNNLNTNTKGIHPLRICYESQVSINEYILNNIEKLTDKHEYSLIEIEAPYFTNSLFFIRTNEWKKILNHSAVDSYDEIALNRYKTETNKKFMFIKNGFGVHPMFNTVYGNRNQWGIGGENGYAYEQFFYNNLLNKITKS